jgi:hypothetical protein
MSVRPYMKYINKTGKGIEKQSRKQIGKEDNDVERTSLTWSTKKTRKRMGNETRKKFRNTDNITGTDCSRGQHLRATTPP